jgi:hypothetical protein
VGQAIARGLRVVELEVPYRPRIAGTASKLRAFRDGRRILGTILRQSLRFRPWRPLIALAVPTALFGLIIGPWPVALVATIYFLAAIVSAVWVATRRARWMEGSLSRHNAWHIDWM